MAYSKNNLSSQAVVAAVAREASHLTDAERAIILEVLGRDEKIRRDQEEKISQLKKELQVLRRKGAIKVSSDWSVNVPDPDRCCGRCRTQLGRIINRGSYCKACRLRVCRNCREYTHKIGEWVCTVCHKHMEIQLITGEWMNQYIRRPSRRRDHIVYVPAADIIKRTIKRSWTISNPTPRWKNIGDMHPHRLYSSLPKSRDFSDYSYLVQTRANAAKLKDEAVNDTSNFRRTKSEDVPTQAEEPVEEPIEPKSVPMNEKPKVREVRENPLIKYLDHDRKARKNQRLKKQASLMMETDSSKSESSSSNSSPGPSGNKLEKRVSFNTTQAQNKLTNVLRTQSLNERSTNPTKALPIGSRSLPERTLDYDDAVQKGEDVTTQLEMCDIEPLSGTVFRKVTIRRRKDNLKKMSAVDAGWRRGPDPELLDILLPDGEDYKLVFINSDSSSKEEDVEDNDSVSTASSFPIDDCEWDYFEPGASASNSNHSLINWNSPFGSPRTYRRTGVGSPIGSPHVFINIRESDTGTDDDNVRRDSASPAYSDNFKNTEPEEKKVKCVHQCTDIPQQHCKNCGAPTQYIPIPVAVPMPFPVPTLWTPQDTVVLYDFANTDHNFVSRFRASSSHFWPYMTDSSLRPILNSSELGLMTNKWNRDMGMYDMPDCRPIETKMEEKIKVGETKEVIEEKKTESNKENSSFEETDIDIEISGHLTCENKKYISSTESYDDSSDATGGNKKREKVKRVYTVNGEDENDSDANSSISSRTDGDDPASHSSCQEDNSSSVDSDSDVDSEEKTKRFSRVFVVNKNISSSSIESMSSETDTSDNDTDTEMDCTVILTNVSQIKEEDIVENKDEENDAMKIEGKQEVESSSPCLSDVSAESLNSSDVEQNRVYSDDQKAEKEEAKKNVKAEERNSEVEVEEVGSERNDGTEIRSTESVSSNNDETTSNKEGEASASAFCDDGERAGAPVTGDSDPCSSRNAAARYTSLVMITQEATPSYQQVSVVTTDTTTLVPDDNIVVRHTNWRTDTENNDRNNDIQNKTIDGVTVITGVETLSAFEEGLADDDSWVENLSNDDDDETTDEDTSSGEEVTLTCSAATDHEDELRGYHRTAIDFTLHTIVEESCEESEPEQTVSKKRRPTSATDLEKYFFFGLGDGQSINLNRDELLSETSSIYSEGMDSMGMDEALSKGESCDPADLASSRLEKYFLSGFMGFTAVGRRDSDGSVGSDSEGKPSPEQRRKKLVRARGTGRSHSSSLDNLLTNPDLVALDPQEAQNLSEVSDSDTNEGGNSFEKSDGQFDTVKRKKGKKNKNTHSSNEELKMLEVTQEVNENNELSDEEEDGNKTPQPESCTTPSNLMTTKNQQSRDSGFIGSCDDLLKEQSENKSPELNSSKSDLKPVAESADERKSLKANTPPVTSLTRKDSFNNWSSDEETNLMMCKMRQFFKTLVANSQYSPSKPTTPTLGSRISPKPIPSARIKNRCKPPQLVYFENELTRLMKTVPGIRDDQVREIVEYLSSEDTWSDSYDSSDYTSSDLEGGSTKSALQQQISDSCKQIINKFDNPADDEGDEGDGGIIEDNTGINKETAFVYQKLVASLEKMATGETMPYASRSSPPLIAKVMHHIGSRLVALMHEVSSGESHKSNSPKAKHSHRRLYQKISSNSTTTDDDSTSDSNLHDNFLEDNYNILPRSRSHDILLSENKNLHQSSSGVSDIAEEREASDCERFSWRGSFESALLASDSRNKLSLIGGESSASAIIAAKRRSAGDLLFNHKSREHLDRVRSCGSIGGGNIEEKLWVSSSTRPTKRRSSVPDATCGSDGEDEDEEVGNRRNLQTGVPTSNSLPRLPTSTASNAMQKAQSMYQFTPQNVKSARYRPPGYKLTTTIPKRASSAPGLQLPRRNRRSQQYNVPSDDSINESYSSPILGNKRLSQSSNPSPVAQSSRRGLDSKLSSSQPDWHYQDDDIDRLVMNTTRNSLSSLGLRSDSMASVYSGAGEGRYGTVAVRGQVEFGLEYNYKAGALEIHVKQCKDLAAVDTKRNRSDPYVKVYLLPDKSKSGKRKTKVKKHSLNPVFDENLKFHITLNELETRTLWLTVWHSDMFGRNDFLGEVMMTLENKVFDDTSPKWYNLQERTEPFEDVISFKGEIIVCLKFVPPDMTLPRKGKRSRGSLHVLVKDAKSLIAVKTNGTSDPFCKSYLLPEKGRHSKQKTPVAKRTINPVWNYTFVYEDVTLQELAERCLELTVWDHDRLASNEFLGGVRFSLGTGKHYGKAVDWMDATGKEMSLWKSMLERPNLWVEGCLALRSSLDTRAT